MKYLRYHRLLESASDAPAVIAPITPLYIRSSPPAFFHEISECLKDIFRQMPLSRLIALTDNIFSIKPQPYSVPSSSAVIFDIRDFTDCRQLLLLIKPRAFLVAPHDVSIFYFSPITAFRYFIAYCFALKRLFS